MRAGTHPRIRGHRHRSQQAVQLTKPPPSPHKDTSGSTLTHSIISHIGRKIINAPSSKPQKAVTTEITGFMSVSYNNHLSVTGSRGCHPYNLQSFAQTSGISPGNEVSSCSLVQKKGKSYSREKIYER
jgi:hypothetical protein